MSDTVLDNPVWAALTSHHRSLAVMAGDNAARYPAEVVPFVAVGSSDPRAAEALARLVAPGESVYFVGVVPELGREWQVETRKMLPQLVCRERIPLRDGPAWTELTEPAHRADMIALTTRVFPGYFRPRTAEMGRYVGIYASSLLAAMTGERLRIEGFQEISAVCTHTDFLGRGYAQRLVAAVANAALERGSTPFLHVYRDNVRAMSMYEKLGFRHRADLPICHVRRTACAQ